MGFDLSSLINEATQFTANAQNNQNSSGGPRLVYPGPGTLKVKLLYNPKSNLVARQIKRHKVESASATCLATYGQECPICKSVANIKNATGVDLWKYNAKSRGLSYAQYVGSQDYKWDEGKEPQVGELILLMYPWTVYQDINRLISQAGPQADKLIASNEGKIVNIIRWTENSQVKYKCEVDAFAPDFKSCTSEEEFDKFLNELPDLNEAICPAAATPDVIKVAVDLSESLNRNYLKSAVAGIPTAPAGVTSPLSGTVPMAGLTYPAQPAQMVMPGQPQYATSAVAPQVPVSPVMPQVQVAPQVPVTNGPVLNDPPFNPDPAPVMTPATAPVTNASGANYPECMGNHVDGNPKCLSCPFEMQCMLVNQK